MNNEQISFKQKVLQIIPRLLIILAVIAGAALVSVLVLFYIDGQKNARLDDATLRLEKIEELHANYLVESDEAAKATIFTNLQTAIGEISTVYQGTYYQQKGEYLLANIAYEKKDYVLAEEQFLKAVEILPKNYLAAIGLFNAAVCAENSQKLDIAIQYLERIVNEFGKTSPEVPRALMNIGRIHEDKSDFINANAAYTRIVDEYSSSDWTKIARDRIIYLKTQGKI
jgi:tetratricopeptide (TPR) repeat protein